jgi:hypothetical protein
MRVIPFRGPKKRIKKTDKFVARWREIQGYCRDKASWANALIEADKLLDSALKKRRFKGKSMGERMVAAQRFITDNDDIWDAHNLVKKLTANPDKVRLRESDVKEALLSFKLALKDLGAFPAADTATPKDKTA